MKTMSYKMVQISAALLVPVELGDNYQWITTNRLSIFCGLNKMLIKSDRDCRLLAAASQQHSILHDPVRVLLFFFFRGSFVLNESKNTAFTPWSGMVEKLNEPSVQPFWTFLTFWTRSHRRYCFFLLLISPDPTVLSLVLRGNSFSLAGEHQVKYVKQPREKNRKKKKISSYKWYLTSLTLHLEILYFLVWVLSRPSCLCLLTPGFLSQPFCSRSRNAAPSRGPNNVFFTTDRTEDPCAIRGR